MSRPLSKIIKEGNVQYHGFEWHGAADAEPPLQPFIPESVTPPGEAEPAARPATPEPAAPSPPPEPKIDVDAIRKQAFQEGFQAGQDSGKRAAQAESDAKIAALGQAVAALTSHKDRLRHEVEREVVDLAMAVARRVVRREISVDPRATAGIVRSVLDESSAGEVQRIRANPADVELLKEAVGEGVEILADDGIARGGAVLETTRGSLDARMDTQLDEIERGLADL